MQYIRYDDDYYYYYVTIGGYNNGIDGDHDLLTAKDLMILQDQSNSKYFDNGKLIQEAALAINPPVTTTHAHGHSRHNKDKDVLLKLTDPNSKEYKELSTKLILEHILEKTCSKSCEDWLERRV